MRITPDIFTCKGCQQVIIRNPPPVRDLRKDYCSLACKLWRFHHRDDGLIRVQRSCDPKPIKAYPLCMMCGNVCAKRGLKVCSDRCRSHKARQLMREKRSLIPSHTRTLTCQNRTCSKLFTKTFRTGIKGHKYCSVRCMKRAVRRGRNKHEQRARRAGALCDYGIDPLRVLARDGWRCQLCGCSTPKRLRGKNKPNSPELDHIIPIAAGGGHTWDNVQCTCRSCNISKSHKPLGQLRLAV